MWGWGREKGGGEHALTLQRVVLKGHWFISEGVVLNTYTMELKKGGCSTEGFHKPCANIMQTVSPYAVVDLLGICG